MCVLVSAQSVRSFHVVFRDSRPGGHNTTLSSYSQLCGSPHMWVSGRGIGDLPSWSPLRCRQTLTHPHRDPKWWGPCRHPELGIPFGSKGLGSQRPRNEVACNALQFSQPAKRFLSPQARKFKHSCPKTLDSCPFQRIPRDINRIRTMSLGFLRLAVLLKNVFLGLIKV